ncbi:MAG: Glycosyl transferase family 39 [Candidatus Amesbacteria bacterium GW2011_GWB1_47_19]|nr:MAG: Glycosyl transferase family 39 [Candidatus Amesbacteria bacterium GW2011_GWA1_44_24]KKU31901.1 MAG: glycosyl transferase family 39 [Candidatus Amesbacteria bacterium GW2011_GWC1_46_24]KKU66837.1 MAG: Glycosyl transferase family 39 [Candidatus Amesbacteria bacterium GW2011_GWB1_47_19]OGD05261.1 MAG: hypothetical protein A2379_03615 [Candidatus Amesbacteria bacterium RIFOXYB1_FULL_47_13]HBC73199.1 hypothetical protein [Candidatus Amesbacteria bacterium]
MTRKRIFSTAAVLLVLIFLFIIRVHNYGRWPLAGHADEQNYGWSGLGLIETGRPVGWSQHNIYPKSWTFFDGLLGKEEDIPVGVKMVRPWLDEPPLYSLLSGGVAHLYRDKLLSVLPVSHIRLPSIIFGLCTTLLLYSWGKKWFGPGFGLLPATLYTLTPIFLFGSRYSLPENGISFLFILSLYLFTFYDHRKQNSRSNILLLIGIVIASGLAGLMKPTGFLIIFLFAFFLARYKHWKKAFLIVLGIFPFVGAFLGYYLWQGGDFAWTILRIQGFRPSGWSSLGYVLSTPYYSTSNETFYDGWYIFILVSSLAILILKNSHPKVRYLTTSIVFWMTVIVISSGEQDPLGWYRYPLFPLFALTGSLAVIEAIKKPNLLWALLAIGTWLSSRFYLHNAFMPTTSSLTFKALVILFFLPFLSYEIFPSHLLNRLRQCTLLVLLTVGLYFNAAYIYSVYDIRCEAVSCPIQVENRLSQLRVPFFWRFLTPTRLARLHN